MAKSNEIQEAENLLDTIIKNQPNMFLCGTYAHGTRGEDAAQQCIKFIETYAAWLKTKEGSGG
jgi:hypothetical protein